MRPDDPEWFARELAIAAAPPWWFWRLRAALVLLAASASSAGCRSPAASRAELRDGPLLLAANHIGDFDPFVIAVALHRAGVDAAVHGHRRHLRRARSSARCSSAPAASGWSGAPTSPRTPLRVTEVALVHGGHVVAYPEGRIGLTPDGWPERGRTGLARMALATGVPVIPVSQWGAHEVLQYANDWGKLRTAAAALLRAAGAAGARRPAGALRRPASRAGSATPTGPATRIAAAITRGLVPLRAGEPPTGRLRRPHPADDGDRRLPRRRRAGRHPVTQPRPGGCWTAPAPA